MKTITFYSYKGGVGRTLALVNIANRLVYNDINMTHGCSL
jgi:cellulose biosynthesis protein BcsQ